MYIKLTPATLDDIRLDGKWTDSYYSMTVNRHTEWYFNHVREPYRSLNCRHILLWWHFLYLSHHVSSDKHLYSIHIMIDGSMTPVEYVLLLGKKQLVHTIFFNLLQENMSFTPTRAFAFFNVAVHNAIRQVIPCIIIKGCVVHLTQCVWKKLQATGLQTLYREEKTRGQNSHSTCSCATAATSWLYRRRVCSRILKL